MVQTVHLPTSDSKRRAAWLMKVLARVGVVDPVRHPEAAVGGLMWLTPVLPALFSIHTRSLPVKQLIITLHFYEQSVRMQHA